MIQSVEENGLGHSFTIKTSLELDDLINVFMKFTQEK